MWAGSSAWYERLTCTQEDAGSNPARSTTTEHERARMQIDDTKHASVSEFPPEDQPSHFSTS